MECVICKHGETKEAKVTVTFERKGMAYIFKGVPAEVCNNCGEEYIAEEVLEKLFKSADQAANSGVEVFIQNYEEAS